MMQVRYILDEHGHPQLEPDLMKWAEWFEHTDRHLRKDKLPGDIFVSTVFLGIDYNFGWKGPPLLWETMIFGGQHDQYVERYTSREDALEGHQRALMLVSESFIPQ